jgi:hypothetical protein
MTISTLRPLLISSLFITLFSSHAGLGLDKMRQNNYSSGSQTMIMEVPLPGAEQKASPTMTQTASPNAYGCNSPKDPSLLTHLSLFVRTLLSPFIEAVSEHGVGGVASNVANALSTAATENVGDNSLKVGLSLLSAVYGGTDSFYIPLAVDVAQGIINSQVFLSLAKSIGSKSTVDKAGKVGLILLAAYIIAEAPAARALETINLGTQYVGGSGTGVCSMTSTSTPGVTYAVMKDSSNFVVGYTLSSSASGVKNTHSLAAMSATVTPRVCCVTNTNGSCLAIFPDATNTHMTSFFPNGTVISAASNTDANAYISVNSADCTATPDGNLAAIWGGYLGGDKIYLQTYKNGVPQYTNPQVISLQPTVIQGNPCVVGTGSPSTPVINAAWQGGSGGNWEIRAGSINTITGTAITAPQVISTSTTQQQNARFAGPNLLLWQKGSSQIIGQPLDGNGAPLGNSYILPGTSGQVSNPDGFQGPDGNAVIGLQTAAGFKIGTFALDAAGTSQSTLTGVPINQPGDPFCLSYAGGTAGNYNAMTLWFGPDATTANAQRARNVNILGGTTGVTTTSQPTAPTTTPPGGTGSPTTTLAGGSPTTTPAGGIPTTTPVSSTSSSLGLPGIYSLPFALMTSLFGGWKTILSSYSTS